VSFRRLRSSAFVAAKCDSRPRAAYREGLKNQWLPFSPTKDLPSNWRSTHLELEITSSNLFTLEVIIRDSGSASKLLN